MAQRAYLDLATSENNGSAMRRSRNRRKGTFGVVSPDEAGFTQARMTANAKFISILAYHVRAPITVELNGEKKQITEEFDYVGTQDGIFPLEHDLIGPHRSKWTKRRAREKSIS